MRLTDWAFDPGPVPGVQLSDIRNALEVLQALRRSGQRGIVGDCRLLDRCDPGSNISAVCMRATILLIALEKELLAFWRSGGTGHIKGYSCSSRRHVPAYCRCKEDLSLDIRSFIAALEATG